MRETDPLERSGLLPVEENPGNVRPARKALENSKLLNRLRHATNGAR